MVFHSACPLHVIIAQDQFTGHRPLVSTKTDRWIHIQGKRESVNVSLTLKLGAGSSPDPAKTRENTNTLLCTFAHTQLHTVHCSNNNNPSRFEHRRRSTKFSVRSNVMRNHIVAIAAHTPPLIDGLVFPWFSCDTTSNPVDRLHLYIGMR